MQSDLNLGMLTLAFNKPSLYGKSVIGSTQYYTTRLNRGGDAQHERKKLPHDSKNRCRAENGRKVLNR